MGTLYVVATPIGNVEDLSPRALRILKDVALVAAEDTRHTGALLRRLGVATPLVSYHAFNERSRTNVILEALEAGDVALVTDAGTPAVSDPGAIVVKAAAEAGHQVVPVPGPSALTAALSASGLSEGPSIFLGFLPRAAGERRTLLQRALSTGFAVVLFESPTRTAATMKELAAGHGARDAVVFRELTKVHEAALRGTVGELATRVGAEPVRGEVVIVVGPATDAGQAEDPEALVRSLVASGMRPSDAAREAARMTGLPKSGLYEMARRVGEENQAG